MRMFFAITAIGAFALTALAADTTKTVAPGNMAGWLFYQDLTDTVDPLLGTFVLGPATPPLGVGSVQISTSGLSRPNIATYQFAGVKLTDITTLKFATYNPSAGNGGGSQRSGYLHFNVDFNGTDTWQRRLVYVPANNGTVVQNTWKEWDTINAGTALWGWSGWSTTNPWPDGYTSPLRSWSSILTAFPNARIRATDSFLGIRVGEPYPDGYTENIDSFKFGTAAGTTTFNFDPFVVATDKEACKNNGWMNLRRADGSSFKNQGDCIQYVNTGK